MSASPEFYKPAPVFSPCSSPLLLHGAGAAGGGVGVGGGGAGGEQEGASGVREEYCCRTPTGDGSELKRAPGTCPPAPRKPRAPPAPCRKRLFEVEVFSLRLEELERLFWRPHAPSQSPSPAPEKKKKRRQPPPRSRARARAELLPAGPRFNATAGSPSASRPSGFWLLGAS